ncbi:MAG: hypothetical protein ACK4E1_07620 [Fervidobacterium nodosum]
MDKIPHEDRAIVWEVIKNPSIKTAMKSVKHERIYNILRRAVKGDKLSNMNLFSLFEYCPVCGEVANYNHLISKLHLENLRKKVYSPIK